MQPSTDEAVKHARDLPNVQVLLTNSHTLTYDPAWQIDFVFIDGDHSWEGVRSDTDRALEWFANEVGPARHGTIVWHDFYPHHVISVYDYLCQLERRFPGRIRPVCSTCLAYLDL